MSSAALHLTRGDGPESPPSSRPRSGIRTAAPVRFDASGADRTASARAELPDGAATVGEPLTGRVIARGDRLSWAVYPDFDATARAGGGFDAASVALDLVLDDGSLLSDAGLVDQYGHPVSAAGQREAKTLVVDQWNLRTVDLTRLEGRTIHAVELVADPRGDDPAVTGWIDAIELAPAPPEPGPTPADLVDIRRGTHATGAFSRGNNAPAVAVPHGFHFLVPVTNARTVRWLYAYAADDPEPGVSALQAFSVSHQASPWMADRGIVQVMPSTGTDVTPAGRSQRFRHADEEAHPYRYAVELASGIRAAMSATDHAAVLEFTYPGDDAVVVIDQVSGLGALTVDPDAEGRARIQGWADGSGSEQRLFFAGELDRPATDWSFADAGHGERPAGAGHEGGVAAWIRVRAEPGEPVRLRLATSFVSVEQARRSLDQETTREEGVDDVAARAREAWNAKLGAVEVEGASADQRVTLASNLYRIFLYPNRASENAGTAEHPHRVYADPFEADRDPATRTDPVVRDGELVVNNGFWDTYRTEWAALQLLDPAGVGPLLDGFVEHYRAGGWTPRWSAPGYDDCMVGTSSDQIFADAFDAGVDVFDVEAAYDSAVRNATVPSSDPHTGRKGLETGIFRGYIPADATDEAMSWSLENAISDFGLVRFSERMLAAHRDGPRADEFRANAWYFANRARGYRLLFDAGSGFFRGRTRDGAFTGADGAFDPRQWGGDYTETNAWGMSVSVPHDPAGLAALHGGREGLATHLDALFSEPEIATTEVKGGYGQVIHEMVEARTVRMGMFGISNQPAHHIPFIYLAAGRPDRTQAITREALDRLFTGSDLGQGYPGDEDNGELSAWWLFAALGLYPLALGSGGFVVTTPLFPRAALRPGTDTAVEIVARGAEVGHRHIRSLTIDGREWTSTFVPHEVLAGGATLEFELSAEPTAWGSAPEDAPPSLGGVLVADAAASSSAPLLVDDSSVEGVTLDGPVGIALAEPAVLAAYTLTAGPELSGWLLEGREADADPDGGWRVLDHRRGEEFRWERQTRPFLLADPGTVAQLRLTVDGGAILYQVEAFPAG